MTLTKHLVDPALFTADLVLGQTPIKHLHQFEAAQVRQQQRLRQLQHKPRYIWDEATISLVIGNFYSIS